MTTARSTIAVRLEGRGTRARARAVPVSSVRTWATRMLGALEQQGAELSLVLCDDAFIRDLNRRFADEDHATDVLAFASNEAPGPRRTRGEGPLGDVVISLETAARQAARRRAPLEDEVRLLLAHGLLHLVGYDHRTAAQERIMTARTNALLEAATSRPRRGRRAGRS